jgi:superoxide dismutase, Cu-Zn family
MTVHARQPVRRVTIAFAVLAGLMAAAPSAHAHAGSTSSPTDLADHEVTERDDGERYHLKSRVRSKAWAKKRALERVRLAKEHARQRAEAIRSKAEAVRSEVKSAPVAVVSTGHDAGGDVTVDVKVTQVPPGDVQVEVTPNEWLEKARHPAVAFTVMTDREGRTVGWAALTPDGSATRVDVRLNGLQVEPGYRGLHLHTNAVCDPTGEEPFASAGGHWDPTGSDHGAHPGDLAPLLVLKGGSAKLSFLTDRFEVADLAEPGVALILHESMDNFAHVPERYWAEGADMLGPDETTRATGDAGGRLACGVVKVHPGHADPAVHHGDMAPEGDVSDADDYGDDGDYGDEDDLTDMDQDDHDAHG